MIEMSPAIATMIANIIHGNIKNLMRCNKHKFLNVCHADLWNKNKTDQQTFLVGPLQTFI